MTKMERVLFTLFLRKVDELWSLDQFCPRIDGFPCIMHTFDDAILTHYHMYRVAGWRRSTRSHGSANLERSQRHPHQTKQQPHTKECGVFVQKQDLA